MPGALEIPAAIAIAVDAAEKQQKPYDGGGRARLRDPGRDLPFRHRVEQSARALMDFRSRAGLPLGNGILTVDTEAQAGRGRASARGQGRRRRARGARADRGSSASAPRLIGEHGQSRPSRRGRKANRRGAARLAAVQALYQMDIGGDAAQRHPGRVREPLDRPRGRGRGISAGGGRVLPRRRVAAWCATSAGSIR